MWYITLTRVETTIIYNSTSVYQSSTFFKKIKKFFRYKSLCQKKKLYLFNGVDMDRRCQSKKEIHLDPKKKTQLH
jgi:hypothetical protein